MKALPPDRFPKPYFLQTGKYEFSNSGWWCSGFYPGTAVDVPHTYGGYHFIEAMSATSN